jgi:hypothetical protein
MTALPVHHIAPNLVARAVRDCIMDLMRLSAPKMVGPADACDMLARAEMLEQMALIFDRAIMAVVEDTAERCEHIDRGYFENAVAIRLAPLISQFDEAAERLGGAS